MESNRRDRIEVPQPRALAERRDLARLCAERLALTAPLLIDGMENEADRAYGAWPERLYVVSPDRRIVYQGGKGPYGFSIEELEGFLQEYLPQREE